MIKDFLNRKNISKFASTTINNYLTKAELRKIRELSENKRDKRVKILVQNLKREFVIYSSDNQLGIYGKAKLAKVVQEEMQNMDLDENIISYIVNKLIR
ncbi:hypothetical protein ACUR5C_06255 [Aliikangiella sp. IMCC44653]